MHMQELEEMIRKIVDDGDRAEMEELSDILVDVSNMVYDYDEKKGEKIFMKIYRMAYGNILSKSMAEEIVSKMKPYGMRWSLQETRQIQQQYGLDYIRDVDFFIVLNSAFNDYRDIFGDNIDLYVKYTRNFIEDEDAKDGKIFLYFTTIPK